MLKTLANFITIAGAVLFCGHSAAFLTIETFNPEQNPQLIIPNTQAITLEDLKEEARRQLGSEIEMPLETGFTIRSSHPLKQVELLGAPAALVITDQLRPALLNQCLTQHLEDDIQLAACPASFGTQEITPEPELYEGFESEILPGRQEYLATVIPLSMEQLFSSAASATSITVRNSAGQTTSSSLSIQPAKQMTMPPVMERLSLNKNQSLRAEKSWLEGESIVKVFGPRKRLPGDSQGALPVAVTLSSPDLYSTVHKNKYVHTAYQMIIDPGVFRHTTSNQVLQSAARRDLKWSWVVSARGTKIGGWCGKHHKKSGYAGFRILNGWWFDVDSARMQNPSEWHEIGNYPSNKTAEIPLNIWHMGTHCTSPHGEQGYVKGRIIIRMKSQGAHSRLPKQIKHPGKYRLQINVTLTETL